MTTTNDPAADSGATPSDPCEAVVGRGEEGKRMSKHTAEIAHTGTEWLRAQRGLGEAPITYGMCLSCRSIEVALNKVIGTRDFSDIGESAVYPVGRGCEVCS